MDHFDFSLVVKDRAGGDTTRVRRITKGKYSGQIQTSESAQAPFTGTFEAKKQ